MSNNREIILLRGIQASGKSTFAKEQLNRYPGKYKRVNKDSLRDMLDNSVFDFANEKFILAVRDFIVERALLREFDVIVDDTNFSDKHWTAMCEIAQRVGNVRVYEKFFSVPLDEALRRNAARPNPVPEGVIVQLYEKHVKGRSIECRDVYFPKEPPKTSWGHDSSKIPAVIVDMDGTLALNVGRSYYDMTRILEDAPNVPICDLVRSLKKSGYVVIVVSGRDDSCLEDTKTWLQANDVPYDGIFMRQVGDRRKDAEVKEEIYRRHIEALYAVVWAIDDRPAVVHLWRKLGITTLQLNDLDF